MPVDQDGLGQVIVSPRGSESQEGESCNLGGCRNWLRAINTLERGQIKQLLNKKNQ